MVARAEDMALARIVGSVRLGGVRLGVAGQGVRVEPMPFSQKGEVLRSSRRSLSLRCEPLCVGAASFSLAL
jgi:hypothetical protein